jgi:hypothetical protein
MAAAAQGLTPQPQVARTDDALRLGHRLAACAVGHNRGGTVALLEELPASTGEMIASGRVRHSWRSCYNQLGESEDALATPRPAMRALLAEALYERDFGAERARSRTRYARLPEPVARPDPSNRDAQVRVSARASSFATCVAHTRPGDAAALLVTEAASPAEEAVVQRLAPHFRACLPPGPPFEINFALFRGFIAEALYRSSAAPRAEAVQ